MWYHGSGLSSFMQLIGLEAARIHLLLWPSTGLCYFPSSITENWIVSL
jgi:hypothetical protein